MYGMNGEQYMYDVIIIGGGPAGMTAALYCLRTGKTVLILENKGFGGQITYSHQIDNYPGLKGISGNEFADNLLEQVMSFGVETEFATAERIIDSEIEKIVIADGEKYTCKSIIIATGVKARRLMTDGEEKYTGYGVSYCAICDGAFYKNESVAVVGGGNSAIQEALFLSAYCSKVYVIHRRDIFRAQKSLLASIKEKDNIEIVPDNVVTSIEGDQYVNKINLNNIKTGEKKYLDVKGVFIAIGREPDTKIFKDIIKLDENGYILSDNNCETDIKGIFAAGDCRAKEIRQLTTAVSDGSIAAIKACEYIDKTNHTT